MLEFFCYLQQEAYDLATNTRTQAFSIGRQGKTKISFTSQNTFPLDILMKNIGPCFGGGLKTRRKTTQQALVQH